jgi:hypothetical protein
LHDDEDDFYDWDDDDSDHDSYDDLHYSDSDADGDGESPENMTDSQSPLHHHPVEPVPVSSTNNISSINSRSSRFMARQGGGKRRRQHNHVMSQGDFCQLFQHLPATTIRKIYMLYIRTLSRMLPH